MTHDANFTAEKIAKRIELIRPLVFRQKLPLPPFWLLPLDSATDEPPIDADPSTWERIPHNSYWGKPDLNFLMRSHFTVPSDWVGNLALHLPLGEAGDIFTHPEGLVYIDGKPIASADRYHHTVPLPDHVHDGQNHQIALHGWTGLSGWPPDPESNAKLFMETCTLVTRDRPTQFFLWLANAALGTARELLDRRSERHNILTALDRAFLTLDTRDPIGGDAFYDSVPHALEQLRADLAQAGAPQDVTLHAIGHAHMDIAYLWPVSQMRRKVARTSSNALRLMEEYPTFRFSNSQAVLYEFLEEDYPEIFERIRMAVARGQWEVFGGMWVEPDVNLAGAEAVVRQLVLARRYFRRKFGDAETPVLWLPDTFGFPWSLPQLAKQAGIKWFCTNKMNWNQSNRMPSSTFWWQGIDGTQLLSHVLTTPRDVQYLPFPTNYKSDLTAPEVLGTWEHSTAKDKVRDLPICFGYGDGGGGPTEGLIQTAKAYAAMPGMPTLRMSTIREAFEAIEGQADGLPVWNDELYLEGHRGVLTSNGWIKRANRKAEVALHEAEALAVMNGLETDLTPAWQLLCLNQFHDILTGTSIRLVFEDAEKDYAAIQDEIDKVLAQLETGATIVTNTSPYPQSPLVEVGGTQVQMPEIAPYQAMSLDRAVSPKPGLSIKPSGEGFILENASIRATISASGHLTELLDKDAGRQVLSGPGNILQLFEDRPLVWDAWDIDPFFEDRAQRLDSVTTIEIVEDTKHRVALRVEYTFSNSRITQDIRLDANSRRLDFVTDVDWHETHTLLKVAFPIAILSPRATYDIQWGHIERPTHRNTSWDAAKFEVCGHYWADLSDAGYGVALLNDCKYGHDIRDNVMRLSLIKSATMPDVGADQGMHRFTYALLPHDGDWRGTVDVEAAALNHPVRVSGGPERPPLVATDAANVVIETVKPADVEKGFVIRLYEAHRKSGRVRLSFSAPLVSVSRCNLLEDREADLAITDSTVELDVNPFEIVTLLCVTGSP
ncbi:MAG: glycoside hydrolase family 38 C-terminal domain-containing protein [Pseudomonadota bacterium]